MQEIALKKVLVPLDFSEITERVLSYGKALAGLSKADIILFHAVHVPPLAEANTWLDPVVSPSVEQDIRVHLKKTATQKLEEIAARLQTEGMNAAVCVRDGVPYSEIIKCADEHGVDLIVMGSQGHGGISKFLMGSTAERVVRRSRYNVFCVKPVLGGEE